MWRSRFPFFAITEMNMLSRNSHEVRGAKDSNKNTYSWIYCPNSTVAWKTYPQHPLESEPSWVCRRVSLLARASRIVSNFFFLVIVTAPFCLDLYQEILQSPNGALVWSFLKPILHGKILYTPNTPEINEVIQKVSLGAPGWCSGLSIRLVVSTQVTISWSWYRAPHQALRPARSLLDSFSPSLSKINKTKIVESKWVRSYWAHRHRRKKRSLKIVQCSPDWTA